MNKGKALCHQTKKAVLFGPPRVVLKAEECFNHWNNLYICAKKLKAKLEKDREKFTDIEMSKAWTVSEKSFRKKTDEANLSRQNDAARKRTKRLEKKVQAQAMDVDSLSHKKRHNDVLGIGNQDEPPPKRRKLSENAEQNESEDEDDDLN